MKKALLTALIAVAVVGTSVPVSAANVGGDTMTTSASAEVQMVIENPAPVFTVDIPADVHVDADGMAEFAFSMKLEEVDLIPDGQKINISLDGAGYGDVTNTLALVNEENVEAAYEIYSSSFGSKAGDPYAIGDVLAAFKYDGTYTDYNEDGVTDINRFLFIDDFENLGDGVYNGFLTFGISLTEA